MFRTFVLALSLAACFPAAAFAQAAAAVAQKGNLDIYWVDVEGGGATLIVTPSGESFLTDTGNPGERDGTRIFEVATKVAGLRKIDYLLTTHYHGDHVGGAPTLAKLIPIGHYFDHGDNIEAGGRGGKVWDDYLALATKERRTVVKPGDTLPIQGIRVEIVSAAGQVIQKPLPGGGPNPFCAGAVRKKADTTENSQSAGFLLTFGRFRFVDLGDLTWDKETMLACPDNKVGTATIVQATHHGFFNDYSGAPALYKALKPQVVVVNNGERKGLQPSAYELIQSLPGLESVWQLHRAAGSDQAHNTADERVANDDMKNDGHWIKASVAADGSFTITNSRNNHAEKFQSR